ncbi:MAG: hypothetical protein D6803_04830 [Anaerolineae bacterium]|nr:MAG: hypothetical protein D6803_04830 [Anaerolineae bacterium]
MARRTKLTPERTKRICDQVRKGVPYETAARLAGIDPSTFYRWKARGERAKRGLYREFWEALQQADAEAEAALIEETKKERGGPRWILERRWPERWGQKVDVKFEGTVFAVDWGIPDGDETEPGDPRPDAQEA